VWNFDSVRAGSSSTPSSAQAPLLAGAAGEGGSGGGDAGTDTAFRAMLASSLQLPTIPHVAAALIRVADQPRASASDVRDVISTDQALVTKLLRVVNSPMYGMRKRVTTLTHAVAMLGFEAVKNLALAASFSEVLGQSAEGYGLDPGRLWMHSIAAGCAARLAAERTGYAQPEEAFVAGVIHDVGKLAASVHIQGMYSEILAKASRGNRAFNAVEREAMGFDHAQAGEAVALSWGLPEPLSQCIRWHHEPSRAQHAVLAALVHLGDALAVALGYGLGLDGVSYTFHQSCLTTLGMSSADSMRVAAIMPDAVEKLAQITQG